MSQHSGEFRLAGSAADQRRRDEDVSTGERQGLMCFAAQVVSDQREGVFEVRGGYFRSQLLSDLLNVLLKERVLDRRSSLADVFRKRGAEASFFVTLRARGQGHNQNHDNSHCVSPSTRKAALSFRLAHRG